MAHEGAHMNGLANIPSLNHVRAIAQPRYTHPGLSLFHLPNRRGRGDLPFRIWGSGVRIPSRAPLSWVSDFARRLFAPFLLRAHIWRQRDVESTMFYAVAIMSVSERAARITNFAARQTVFERL